MKVFQAAGLTIRCSELQRNMPKGTFKVIMYVIESLSPIEYEIFIHVEIATVKIPCAINLLVSLLGLHCLDRKRILADIRG